MSLNCIVKRFDIDNCCTKSSLDLNTRLLWYRRFSTSVSYQCFFPMFRNISALFSWSFLSFSDLFLDHQC